jgi:PAS domain S-box-containing protein
MSVMPDRMIEKIKVLLVDDDEDDFILTKDLLSEIEDGKFELEWAPTFGDALQKLFENVHDIFLVDFRLGEHSGLQLIHEAGKKGIRKPFILLTGQDDRGLDLLALKAGASDYLRKSKLDAYNLERAITYAIERTHAFEDIFEKEQKYRTLFENSKDAIFITDQNFNLQEVNQCTLNLFDLSKTDIQDLNLKNLFVYPEEYENFVESSIEGNSPSKSQEYLLKTKSGKRLNCLIASGAITDSVGFVKGYQGIIHDISQRKKYEMQVLTAEKLGVTDRIVSTIAHEVRNPVNTITLALNRFKKEHPNEESYTFYTDIIDKSCKRIDQLISQLIESARPSELNLQLGSVNDLMEETLKLADDRIKLLNIIVYKNYEPSIPEIPFDSEKLKIAMLNIIINSIEAMPADTGILEIQTQLLHDNIIITIADNGKGIPKNNLSKLFDPFFTGKKGGMGLGLTSTHTIIKSHNGDINVESEVGIGTKFTVIFSAN